MRASWRCLIGVWWLVAAGCGGGGHAEQIDLGAPIESIGVRRTERLTDGRRALPGAPWSSKPAAIFRDERAFALFDIGETVSIEAAYLQGDNNDRFTLEVSEDGVYVGVV